MSDPLMIDYHDNEWGRPQHDDRKLFEAVILDGFQAGTLSSWRRFVLSPGQAESFLSTSQVPEANKVIFSLRFPDDLRV